MRKSAAVLCRDHASLQVLEMVLEQLGIERIGCETSQAALELVLEGGCSTLIVDFDLPAASEAIRMAALLPPEQKPLLLALASRAWPGTGQAFQSGASRIIYRPLDPEQLKDALASGRKKAKQQRRRVARYETKTLVHLDFESASIPAITIDISEHGLALQATEPVPISSHVPFRCVLPGTHETLQGVAEVIWASDQGRAGLFFARLTPAGRKHLKEWLHKRSHASHSARNGNGTRTDHVQELLPPAEAKVSFSVSE